MIPMLVPARRRTRGSRHRGRFAALALLLAGVVPSGAVAATAPVRDIGFDASGARTKSLVPVAVSADGGEVVGTLEGSEAQPFVRNVVTGATTLLPISGKVLDASADLSQLVVQSIRSYDALDANPFDVDLYLYDRTASRITLISRDAGGRPFLAGKKTEFAEASISGNGRVISFRARSFDPSDPSGRTGVVDEQWRWVRGISTLSRISSLAGGGRQVFGHAIDDLGRVTVDAAGIRGVSATYPFPGQFDNQTRVAVAADGSAVAVQSVSGLNVVRTSGGAVTAYALPTALLRSGFRLFQVASGGASVIVGQYLSTAPSKYVLSRLTPDGTLTQVGGDIPMIGVSGVEAISANLAFAATPISLAQLGSSRCRAAILRCRRRRRPSTTSASTMPAASTR